jgi:hypothetical protein
VRVEVGEVLGLLLVLAFLGVVYAIMFGRVRPGAAWGRRRPVAGSPDVSLLEHGIGGGFAFVVVAADLADVAGDEVITGLWLAVGAGALLSAVRARLARAVLFGTIGLAALATSVTGVLAGACGASVGSTGLAVAALAPAVVLVIARVLAGVFQLLRPGRLIEDLGVGALAASAVVSLGTFAVDPGGISLLAEAAGTDTWWSQPWVVIVLLCVIAAGVGLRPRVGADLVAIGLVVLQFGFVGFGAPCGLQRGPLLVSAAVFLGTLLLLGPVAARFAGRR